MCLSRRCHNQIDVTARQEKIVRVHFIRHAQAVTRSTQLADEYRALTCRGRKRFRQVAACLKKTDFNPDLIITSCKIRAVQTADILAESLLFNSDIMISTELSTMHDITVIEKILTTANECEEIVIIGHEPYLGRIVSSLLNLAPPCQLSKGSTVSLNINLSKSGLTAGLTGIVTGSGRLIDKPGAAHKWLEEKACTDNKGE